MKSLTVILAASLLATGALASSSDAENDPPQYRVLFLGDTSFGEPYQRARLRSGLDNVLEERGYSAFLEPWGPFLSDADLIVANLETPLTWLNKSPLSRIKQFVHFGDPPRTTKALVDGGIDAVALGNNHTMDFGEPGLLETIQSLDGAGIKWLGAGRNEAEAGKPLRMKFSVDGATQELAVFSGFEFRNRYEDQYTFYAKGDRAGVAPLSVDQISSGIQNLKREDERTVAVVFPHWGFNYETQSQALIALAHEFIDAGADLIVGHGSHTLQGIERYKDKWIFYGIGNFVFLSDGRYEENDARPFGGLMQLDFVPEGMNIRMYPIFTDNLKTDFRARPVTEAEFGEVAEELRRISPDPSLFDREIGKGKDVKGFYIEAQTKGR